MKKLNLFTEKFFVLIISTAVFFAAFSPASGIHKSQPEHEPGILPSSILYFGDKFFENIRLTFTFDKKAKAMLYVDFIGERLSEAEAVLSERNQTSSDYLDASSRRIQNHVDEVSILLSDIREEGRQADSLALEIDEGLKVLVYNFEKGVDDSFFDLQRRYERLKDGSEEEEVDFDELRSLVSDMKFIELEADRIKSVVRENEEKIEDFMLDINKVKDDLEEVKNDFQHLRDESDQHNLQLPSGYFMTLEHSSFIEQAESLIDELKFNEASESIEKAEESVSVFRDVVDRAKNNMFERYGSEITILEAKDLFEKTSGISTEVKNSYTRFISEAEAEFGADNFEEADRLGRQAKESIIEEN